MPELVSSGPRIPVTLMNEVDAGSAVFFCGAGVSVGEGSQLPNFARLVDHVYEANRMEPDDVEREALHVDEPNPSLRKPQFDKALGLLERPERLGASVLRRTVIERLSTQPNPSAPGSRGADFHFANRAGGPPGYHKFRQPVRRSRA